MKLVVMPSVSNFSFDESDFWDTVAFEAFEDVEVDGVVVGFGGDGSGGVGVPDDYEGEGFLGILFFF